MILGIGIDSVDICRFNDWHTKPLKSLQRIFSDQEITYCLANTTKSAERFAIRFAIREAVFKVITTIDPEHTIPLLGLCKAITVTKNKRGTPQLIIDWDVLASYSFVYPQTNLITWHLSCTHTDTVATASVIAETVP